VPLQRAQLPLLIATRLAFAQQPEQRLALQRRVVLEQPGDHGQSSANGLDRERYVGGCLSWLALGHVPRNIGHDHRQLRRLALIDLRRGHAHRCGLMVVVATVPMPDWNVSKLATALVSVVNSILSAPMPDPRTPVDLGYHAGMGKAPGGSAGSGHGSDPDEDALLRRIRDFLRHGSVAEAGLRSGGNLPLRCASCARSCRRMSARPY
jgi:hypothetical protein